MASNLPDYVASATPSPNRIPWYKSTAQTYAGIMLWFVFWLKVAQAGDAPGGALTQGLQPAFIGLIGAALFCYALFYLAPAMFGLKSRFPLYIVGTSTYGVQGGFLMPGFLMGILQFGWLGVNAYFSAMLLAAPFNQGPGSPLHLALGAIWAIAAAFMGLKGIQYVARVATYFPIIPLAVLLVLTATSIGGLGDFDQARYTEAAIARAKDKTQADKAAAVKKATESLEQVRADEKLADREKQIANAQANLEAAEKMNETVATPLSSEWAVIATLMTVIIGFFATAGAAGVDFGMSNRDGHDVQWGGLVGITGATIFAGGLALLIVAGANGKGIMLGESSPTALMSGLVGETTGNVFMYLLAVAAFPPACFSAFIAANSFKTTLPKVNPFISVGVGTAVSIALVVTGWAGQAGDVFSIIGASFGPICGAMAADYLLSKKQWAGPRAGFNLAGWISWAVGFVVGAADMAAKYIPALKEFEGYIPVPPLAAMIVGFVLYLLLAMIGLQSRTLEKPAAAPLA